MWFACYLYINGLSIAVMGTLNIYSSLSFTFMSVDIGSLVYSKPMLSIETVDSVKVGLYSSLISFCHVVFFFCFFLS